MRFRLIIAFCCCAFLSACFSFGRPRAIRPEILGFTELDDGTKRAPRLAGHIAMVNTAGNFVLIETDAWSAPKEGTALKCLRYKAETAILATGRERRGNYIVADIIRGEPQRGDEVYQ